jgi:hypothetical protein
MRKNEPRVKRELSLIAVFVDSAFVDVGERVGVGRGRRFGRSLLLPLVLLVLFLRRRLLDEPVLELDDADGVEEIEVVVGLVGLVGGGDFGKGEGTDVVLWIEEGMSNKSSQCKRTRTNLADAAFLASPETLLVVLGPRMNSSDFAGFFIETGNPVEQTVSPDDHQTAEREVEREQSRTTRRQNGA